MNKYNQTSRLPFDQSSGNIQLTNSQDRPYQNYEQCKEHSQTAMRQHQPNNLHHTCSGQWSRLQNFDEKSLGDCNIRPHPFLSTENETRHRISEIHEKTETKNIIKDNEHLKPSMTLKQNNTVRTEELATAEKKVSMLTQYPVRKHLDKTENLKYLENSGKKGSEINKNELDKTTHSVLKVSMFDSIHMRKKSEIGKDVIRESKDKLGSIPRDTYSEIRKRLVASVSDKPTRQTIMKQNRTDLAISGITTLKGNPQRGKQKNFRTVTKVNLLEKKSLGYTAPDDKRNISGKTTKISSLKERNRNKELVEVGGNRLQKSVSDAISEKMHEPGERSIDKMFKSKRQNIVKHKSYHIYEKDRTDLSNSEADRCKGTSNLNLYEMLKKSYTNKNLSNDTSVKTLSHPVVSGNPVTVLNAIVPNVTSLDTFEKKQESDLLKSDKSFAQPYKDFSLPEHNKNSYHMKINDRSLLTSSLPDLVAFGREIPKKSSEKQLSPTQTLKSGDRPNSIVTNANIIQQSRKLYWEDVFSRSNCSYKRKNSSKEQITPGSLNLEPNDSSDTSSSGPVNQTNSKERSESQKVGNNLTEANSDVQKTNIMSQKGQELTEIPYTACPVGTSSSEKSKFDDRNHCLGQHVSCSSQGGGNGKTKQVNNNALNQAKMSSDFESCTQFNDYQQSFHLNPSFHNAFRYNYGMPCYDSRIFNASCGIQSFNGSACSTQCSYTQQNELLDENILSSHRQGQNHHNTECSFVNQKLMEFNQKNTMNASDYGTQGTESFYMKSEIIQQKNTNRCLNERHDIRTSFTKGMESSWYDGSRQQYWNHLTGNRNQVIHGMNINVFPTIIAMPGNELSRETEVITDDYCTSMTEGGKNLTVDMNNKMEVYNKTGNLPVLFDVQNVLDEISQPEVSNIEKSEKEGKGELEVAPFKNSKNKKVPYLISNSKLNPSNIKCNTKEASEGKPDESCKLISYETGEKTLILDDATGNILCKEDLVEISQLPKIARALDNKIFKVAEKNIEQVHCSKSLDSCPISNDTQSGLKVDCKITIDSKITEKYKYPMVLMSPLKMTKELEDMIDNCIAKNKLDSPMIPIIQSPSISVQTPITPLNTPVIVLPDFSPPLLSPIGLSTLSEKMPFDRDYTESCKPVKKSKKKRKSRSKVLKDIVPSKHNEREKTLFEDAKTFLGTDFSCNSARKRTHKMDTNNKKRSKKTKLNIKETLKDNEKLAFENRSENKEGRREILFNNHFKDKEADKSKIVDIVNDNSNGLLKKELTDKKHTEYEVCDIFKKKNIVGNIKEEKKLPMIQQLLKKRKHPLKFSVRINKENDKTGDNCEMKKRIESKSSDIRKKSKSMKSQKHNEIGAHSEKCETNMVTMGSNEILNGEIDAKQERNVKCTKTLEMPHIMRKCKNFGISNVPKTKEEKRNDEKLATTEISLKHQEKENPVGSKVIGKDQQLILQTSFKKKGRSKYRKRVKETNDSIDADLRMPISIDERDEAKLTKNSDIIKVDKRVEDANFTDENDKKNKTKITIVIKRPDAPRKDKRRLKESKGHRKKREQLNLKESDKIVYSAKTNTENNKDLISPNSKVCNEVRENDLTKCSNAASEEIGAIFNILNKRRKLGKNIKTKAMKVAIIKGVTETDGHSKMQGVVVDNGKRSTLEEIGASFNVLNKRRKLSKKMKTKAMNKAFEKSLTESDQHSTKHGVVVEKGKISTEEEIGVNFNVLNKKHKLSNKTETEAMKVAIDKGMTESDEQGKKHSVGDDKSKRSRQEEIGVSFKVLNKRRKLSNKIKTEAMKVEIDKSMAESDKHSMENGVRVDKSKRTTQEEVGVSFKVLNKRCNLNNKIETEGLKVAIGESPTESNKHSKRHGVGVDKSEISTQEEIGESFNVLNKRRKLSKKIKTEALKVAIDKDLAESIEHGKKHGKGFDKGKRSTQENSSIFANTKAGKSRNCQNDLLPVISPRAKSKKGKKEKKRFNEDPGFGLACSKELNKRDLAKQTNYEITGSTLETTKKGALKSRKMVSDHLKKYDKESGTEVKSLKSKSKKLTVKYDGQVICQICDKKFATKKHLHCHLVICHPYRCMWCKVDFDNKEASRVHYFTHMKKTYQCDLCDMKYGNQITYELHMKSQRHKKALRCTGISADVENCGQDSIMQKDQMTQELGVGNIGKTDDQQSSTDTITQFYLPNQQKNSNVLRNDTGFSYHHAGYDTEAYNSDLLPSYHLTGYSTRQNTNISSKNNDLNDDSHLQSFRQSNRSDTNENLMETSSVVYDNGKVYTKMTDVRSSVVGDGHGKDAQGFEKVTDVRGYKKVTEEELIHPDEVTESSLLCRIANSFLW